jgi:hypothetical protein
VSATNPSTGPATLRVYATCAFVAYRTLHHVRVASRRGGTGEEVADVEPLRSEEQSRVANAFGALSGIRSVITNDEDRPAWSERTDCPPQHAPALVTRDAENGSG